MKSPPKYIIQILDLILKQVYADEIIGDLFEWFELHSAKRSSFNLHWYAIKVLIGSIKLRKIRSFSNILKGLTNSTMISNQLRMSLKALLANKTFTIINLIGLTVSFAAFMFIYSYISYEKSFDQFHVNKDKIYRVIKKYSDPEQLTMSTPTPLANAFHKQFGDAIKFARFGQDPVVAEVNENKYYEENFYWGDSTIFDVFTIPFKYGNQTNALKEPNTVVLSETTAKKYFGDTNPVGQLLTVKVYDGNATYNLRVDGVFESFPSNTDIPFEMVGSMLNALNLYAQFNNQWGFNWLHTYALINESDLPRIEAGIPQILEDALGPNFGRTTYYFQPLNQVHLYSSQISGSLTTGNINQVIILSFIAISTVVIAAFNYLNMMASTVNNRRKYVVVNKILGAGKKQLFSQFLLESFISIIIGFVLGYLLVIGLWPHYQSLISKNIPFTQTYQWTALGVYVIIMIVTCLIASLQPAIILSRIRGNTNAIRNNIRQKLQFQRILVASQFAIAVFLICATFIIFKQVEFATSESLGFDSSQLISVKVEDKLLQDKIDKIANELLQIPGVKSATISGESLPSDMNNSDVLYWNETSKTNPLTVHEVSADHSFFEVLEIEFLEGRAYLDNNNYQEHSEIVINEATRDLLGNDFHLNQEIQVGHVAHKIVGVVENYHYSSFKSKIAPVVYFQTTPGTRLSYDNILLRVDGSQISATLSSMEQVWDSFSNNEFFSFHFVDQKYDDLYQSDQKFLNQFGIFAALSIIITCLGLLGMILFVADQKAKEISMRKVLGSSQIGIIALILKRFVALMIIGLIVGMPIAIYFSSHWKQQFIYQTPFDMLDFIVPTLVVLVVSVLTLGRSALKISSTNPVKYLRNE